MQCNLDGQAAYNGVGALESTAPPTAGPSGGSGGPDGPWTNGNLKIAMTSDEAALIVRGPLLAMGRGGRGAIIITIIWGGGEVMGG